MQHSLPRRFNILALPNQVRWILMPKPEFSRSGKDETFLEMALVISKRATCTRTQQGALLVDSRGFVVSLGYNGSPSGMRHCEWDSATNHSKVMCVQNDQCMCL